MTEGTDPTRFVAITQKSIDDAKDETLKPCPFCGGEPKGGSLNCGCLRCGATWPLDRAFWNTRANEPTQAEGMPDDDRYPSELWVYNDAGKFETREHSIVVGNVSYTRTDILTKRSSQATKFAVEARSEAHKRWAVQRELTKANERIERVVKHIEAMKEEYDYPPHDPAPIKMVSAWNDKRQIRNDRLEEIIKEVKKCLNK